MRPGRKTVRHTWLALAAAFVMLGAIVFLGFRVSDLRKEYSTLAAITPVPTMSPPNLTFRATDALFRMGSIGPEVKTLQNRLKELGFYQGDIDGQFGNGTREAVVLFQQQYGLQADGIAGAETLAMLENPSTARVQATPSPKIPAGAVGAIPILVNKQNVMRSDYVPGGMVYLRNVLPETLAMLSDTDVQGERTAVMALKLLLEAAHLDGISVWQVSAAYRSPQRQQELLDRQIQAHVKEGLSQADAESAARMAVAPPGASEHQLGLAFDMTVPGRLFAETTQAQWLKDNCYKFGFILRYTPEKEKITGFVGEPWHIRYVGAGHAAYMEQNNLALEEYVRLLQNNQGG